MRIQLGAGELSATVEAGPFLTVSSLAHRGAELLAGAEDLPTNYSVHGRAGGITLLHPWANRLSLDEFQAQRFAVSFAGEPGVGRDPAGLPIDGLAAPDGAWSLMAHGETTGSAWLAHEGSTAFPFPHELEVRFEVEPSRMVVTTTLRATTDEPVPLMLGWHPCLRLPAARPRWQLALPARLHVELDARGLPTGDVSYQASEVALLGDRTFDDCFAGLVDGSVLAIAGGGRIVRFVLSSGFRLAQVFAPGDADVIALEPMTAPIDAYVTANGLLLVTQEEPVTVRFAVEVASTVSGP